MPSDGFCRCADVHYIYILFASTQFSIMQKVLTFGEIMLRLSTPGFERFTQAWQFEAQFGGGEANVAVSLANFGIPVKYVTRLPKNDIGHRLSDGIETVWRRRGACCLGR